MKQTANWIRKMNQKIEKAKRSQFKRGNDQRENGSAVYFHRVAPTEEIL